MASFIYLYSKFTEELLLLSAAGIFTLLSIYCYTWVVKKRRLGAARNQIPAGMVKVYLNQLINEAQFVRTQLFGLAGGVAPSAENFAAHFQKVSGSADSTHIPSQELTTGSEIPGDLMERLKALEKQLAEKESMVVNINVEKTKLLEEVENLKQNEKVMGSASAASGNNDDLLKKMKALEERLEEYALFEDDLANLKRLQQENAQLKKQIDQGNSAKTGSPNSAPERNEPAVEVVSSREPLLDQSAIDALLDGVSAVPPTPSADSSAPEPEEPQVDPNPITSISAKTAAPTPPASSAATTTPTKAPVAEAAPKASAPIPDAFENLVDSVETSLSAKAPASPVAAQDDIAQALAAPAQASSANAEKTDEELLKEFESLLNS